MTRAEAFEAVVAAAREMLASSAPKHWPTLRAALTALDALPYPAAPLKPGDETTICHETGDDGYAADILVTVRADEVYLRPRVSACNGTTFGPEMLVDPEAGISLTHAQAAELCATLARVRVP